MPTDPQNASTRKRNPRRKVRIGALVSGGGTNLQAILDGCASGTVHGRVVFVGSDNPDARGLDRAKDQGIPRFVVDYGAILRQYRLNPDDVALPGDAAVRDVAAKSRRFGPGAEGEAVRDFLAPRMAAEALLLDRMQDHGFDLIVLAGFMRILTPYFIDRINTDPDDPRIMNIHPALLPAFPGTDGYGDTFRYGCKVGGCTVHFVDYGEDTGPIIGQKAFEIAVTDSLEDVRKKGLALEWELYPSCIQWFADGRLKTVRKTFRLEDGTTAARTVVVRSDG